MNFAVVTLFPDMFNAISQHGVSGRAVGNGLISIDCINPRDFTSDRHRTVDDRPYGGGPGMVMMVAPLEQAVSKAQDSLSARRAAAAEARKDARKTQAGEKEASCGALIRKESGKELSKQAKVIYLSPQGRQLDQLTAKALSEQESLVLIAGRYEGLDERFIERCVDEELSIGDYVLSGGELPAMVLIDVVSRMIPGVLGDECSASQDSFEYGLLDCPHYTRPQIYNDLDVPDVLLSGDHKKISEWRLAQSLIRTLERRPDLLDDADLDDIQKKLLAEYRRGVLKP